MAGPAGVVGVFRAAPPWSDDEMARLRRLYDAGHSPRVIGAELGRSKNSVAAKLERMQRQADNPPPPVPAPRAVPDREPCPRCSVRGDVGCEHRPAGEAPPRLSSRA